MSEAGFEITETLGHDENALLYRARRRSDRRRVVLKVLDSQTHQARELERLRNEVEVAGDLDQRRPYQVSPGPKAVSIWKLPSLSSSSRGADPPPPGRFPFENCRRCWYR